MSGPDMLSDVMSTRDREELMRDYEEMENFKDHTSPKRTPGQAPSAEN